jgi:hypothetical protein
MSHAKIAGQGDKTHEQFLRNLERKDDVPKERELQQTNPRETGPVHRPRHPEERESEFPVSFRGMNQESDHNKHNHSGQGGDKGQPGHRPQKHNPEEEKQA